jgi:peroxiredoxin
MEMLARGEPLQIGAVAPNFKVSMVNTDELIELADYRGKSLLLLGLFRGIYCAFCRRAVTKLGLIGGRLRPLGIETLAVIGTKLENARLYYRYHPTRMAIAVDPDLATHRAYGLPRIDASWEVVSSKPVNPSNELPVALPLWEATKALGRLDGFKPTDTDRDEGKRTWDQSIGEFLIDRDGVVQWLYMEGRTAADYMARFPPEEELVSVAHALACS